MPLTVLIVPDKFKGTLTAMEAAEAIARGWNSSRPEDALELLPMSDGGDGFGEIISRLLSAAPRTVKTIDAAHRPCEAPWWWHEPAQTAIVESARIIGLAQLPPGKYHPFELDTEGLGAALQAAADHGARCCLVGIGGSATNDAGFGLARALGWQFFNDHGEKITRWPELHALARLRAPDRAQLFEELVVAVDVQNPLRGPTGCTRVYGPQKGLRPDDFEFAERCLERLSALVEKELHLDCAREPGVGAAGGLGYGLRCFAGARLEPGFDLFCRYANLPGRLQAAQLVITGEGALDQSTLMGKGVGEIARLCRQINVPCLGLGGVVSDVDQLNAIFAATHALAPGLTSSEKALAEPALWLERLAAEVAAKFSPPAGGAGTTASS
jgi:glycerate kinase